jgi:hypothetical protein
VQAGWGNTKSAMLELADVAMDEEVKGSVEQAAKSALQAQSSGEADIRGVQGIKSGQNFLVDIEVFAPSHYTVGQLDAIKDAMREQIASDVKGVRRLLCGSLLTRRLEFRLRTSLLLARLVMWRSIVTITIMPIRMPKVTALRQK